MIDFSDTTRHMMLPNGTMIKEPRTSIHPTSKPSRVGGLTAAPRTGKSDLVRYPTRTSAVRALLDAPNPDCSRKLRLTTRLLEPRPSPSELAPPSLEARRLLQGKATDPLPSPTPPGRDKSATARLRLAPASIQEAEGLGRLIRIRRQILGLTQQELADAAQVGRRFISELEAGKPTVELGRALTVCRVLRLSLIARQDDG